MTCTRHEAAAGADRCPACLLELALHDSNLSAPVGWLAGEPVLTIRMPLGHGPAASVYIVSADGPPPRLFRLKTWRTPAPESFLSAFAGIKTRLDGLDAAGIVVPLAAWLDDLGRPSVLSPFRPGISILDDRAARRGGGADERHLVSLAAEIRVAHARGLVHGSIGPGNVMIAPDRASAFLLDFGLQGLLACSPGDVAAPAGDLIGLAALSGLLQARRGGRIGAGP